MTRKIIFIIIGALLFLALLGLLWFWLLHRSPAADTATPGGFGTSTDRMGADGSGTGTGGNDGSSVAGGGQGQTTGGGIDTIGGGLIGVGGGVSGGGGIGGNIDIDSSTGGVSTRGSAIDTGPQTATSNQDQQTGSATSTRGPTQVNVGVNSGTWIGSAASTRDFTPAQINQINSTAGISGTPLISTTPQAAGLGTSGLIIGAAAAGCVAQYLVNEISGSLQASTKDKLEGLTAGPYVVVFDYNASAKLNSGKFKNIEECLVKTIAQAAIDQITRSVVTWINSGFNGQPSFVTNFNQYFANVADQAAGEFIKGSSLSFLCSSFAPQIKIAIAQAYASRNSAATCSLTKVTNNVNGFLRGNWSAGGWGGLLQFTTVPTNNPYGAYAYAQAGLNSSIGSAQANAKSNVSAGGFISLQKETCDTVPMKDSTGEVVGSTKTNCKRVVTTPGAVIEESLKKTLVNTPIDGLNLAQNINDIIKALTNQVMIKALYGGLGNSLGVTNPLAPAIDQQASTQAQALLAGLQASLNYAGQYASVQQGSIADIQNSQSGLNSAFNCWSTAASSTTSAAGQAQAAQKAAEANAAQTTLGARVDAYNNEITRANTSLALIQNLQSQVYFAATPQDVAAAAQTIAAANSQGAFFSQADVTTAQQNRATLQAELAARNQATTASLTECRAFVP